MINIRRSSERGSANYGWLNAKYTFSFANYYDPEHTGFRDLLVLNQDLISPGGGFSPHPHRDMEILTYIISGSLAHKDSMGHEDIIHKGQIQRRSAGSGIVHSEYNPSVNDETCLLQIWIRPDLKGIRPSYENINFDIQDGIQLIVSPQHQSDVATINQNLYVYACRFKSHTELSLDFLELDNIWIQVIEGQVGIDDQMAYVGDGVSIEGITNKKLKIYGNTEFILLNLK